MESNLEKRIKRQVIGKPHRFMAISPLGFEQTLTDELKYIGVECAEDSGIKVAGDGKVEFTAKITEAWKAVAYSRIANRVLMEIDTFKAENFGQLEKHAAEIPWELYLVDCRKSTVDRKDNGATRDRNLDERIAGLVLHTNCKHSRLYHSDAVEERVREVVNEKLLTSNPQIQQALNNSTTFTATHSSSLTAQSFQQHLYINLLDDRCTIWQDLAGEELYKRGHERFVAEAPLKETIAAAMIFEALRLQESGDRIQVSGEPPLPTSYSLLSASDTPLPTSYCLLPTIVDPMAGSGTFSLEAAYIANGLIPGKCRDFALKHQPAFKEATWNFILKGASPQSEPGERLSNNQQSTSYRLLPTIITSDICQRPIDIIKHNVEGSPLKDLYANAGENAIAKINPQLKDFFSYTAQDFPKGAIILLNPPYGKRLDFDAPKLYKMIGEKLTELAHDALANNTKITVAILAPKDCTANLFRECPALDPRHNTLAKIIETSHGGFSLNAIFAKI